MSRPRIVILHYTVLPVIGGVEQVIAEHTRLFRDAGYPVTVVAGRGDQSSEQIIIPELDSEHPDNLRTAQAIERASIIPEFYTLQVRIENWLAPIVDASDVVIAHNILNFHFNFPLTAALHHLMDRGLAQPVIAWCHDISRYVNPSSGATLRFGFPWDLLRTRRPEVTYVAVSAQRRRSLAEIFKCPSEAIHVVPNGVDPVLLLGLSELGRQLVEEFKLLEADLIALMPVRITRAKNIEFALRVIAVLKAAGIHPSLVVTGPPDPHVPDIQAYFDELLTLCHELDLDDEAIFVYQGTPNLSRPLTLSSSDVAELYRVCDLVLMPSHREGFGIPVLEGGLIGKPVFATSIPALEEVEAESVYLIGPDESPVQVADRIRLWMRDDVAHRLRRHVRQAYTWPLLFTRHIEPLVLSCARGMERDR